MYLYIIYIAGSAGRGADIEARTLEGDTVGQSQITQSQVTQSQITQSQITQSQITQPQISNLKSQISNDLVDTIECMQIPAAAPCTPYYPLPRGKSILGLMHTVLLWADMMLGLKRVSNPA